MINGGNDAMPMLNLNNALRKDGLSVNILKSLSFNTKLKLSLRRNLGDFNYNELMADIFSAQAWFTEKTSQTPLALDYRVKSIQSIVRKYHNHDKNIAVCNVFNDLLGFRSLCNSYDEIAAIQRAEHFRVVDMSNGKKNDDSYRGVHVYFKVSNKHYPIEIQYNTYFDRQLNNWLHKYVYKRYSSLNIGKALRSSYENGSIRTEQEFKEVLEDVLSGSQGF